MSCFPCFKPDSGTNKSLSLKKSIKGHKGGGTLATLVENISFKSGGDEIQHCHLLRREEREMEVSVIAHDYDGTAVWSFHGPREGNDRYRATTYALLQCLKKANLQGWAHVVFECDLGDVFIDIQDEHVGRRDVANRFLEIRTLAQSLNTSFKVVSRDANISAMRLAHLSIDISRHKKIAEEIHKFGNGNENVKSQTFTFHELAAATKNFNADCLVGEGGFGRVYKGQLERMNQVVAVKQLDRNGLQGTREFLVEVLMLSLLHHQNLVNLIGYCSDGDQRILVYEYMPFGSLEEHLLDLSPDKKPLDWITRMQIAVGAARGLEYLHEKASPPVIYRDLKASNILLDENFSPKLSDFGLAKLGPTGDKHHVSTRVMGTYGYCAPEYAMTGQLTTKSDVYSFGVVFLEMITGRRVIDNARPTCEQNLVTWAQPLFKDKRKFTLMADPLLEGKYPIKALYQALAVAAMCLQEEDSTRPLISDVVIALEYLTVPKTGEGSNRRPTDSSSPCRNSSADA